MKRWKTICWASVLAVAVLFRLGLEPAYTAEHPAFDGERTDAIEPVFRDYIRRNPGIILEVLRDPEERERLGETQQSHQQISQNQQELSDDAGSPVGGNARGDITIVEFFDYQCPYCKVMAPRLSELLEADGNIRFVYKEWPILGPVSEVAARAALAAWKQGKYAGFHERLMAVKEPLTVELILDTAKSLSLDLRRLEKDMASGEIDDILRRNKALADRLDITATPAFVVGDLLIPEPLSSLT